MFAYLTMYKQPDRKVECKQLIIREGAKMKYHPDDPEDVQFLAVISADEIYHPVVSVEVI